LASFFRSCTTWEKRRWGESITFSFLA
jgi:hypothetical protein